MMKWIDQTLFDDLILTNSDRAERMIRDEQLLLTEVLQFIPDAVLQYRIYHNETEHTNSLESVRVCFVRNAILFSVSKQTYPKTTYRIFCCNDDDLQHTDNYSRTKAHEGLVEPQRIGKLSKRKVEEWVEYQTQYYRNLERINEENARTIRAHIARLEQIPDVLWGKDRQSGTIERYGLSYSFQVERTGVSENIRLSRFGHSLDAFLEMARPYESELPDKYESAH
ncbi:hypothetical protein [uncultured Alistipes sp.]|uniref:hypothetical protein n=1 Tax=uncultured Alistipes sp. TaxID=538949 RepID=UPI0032209929